MYRNGDGSTARLVGRHDRCEDEGNKQARSFAYDGPTLYESNSYMEGKDGKGSKLKQDRAK
jgi:hypothetical protein